MNTMPEPLFIAIERGPTKLGKSAMANSACVEFGAGIVYRTSNIENLKF